MKKNKKNKQQINYLDLIPVRPEKLGWHIDRRERVVLEVKNEGFFNRIAQTYFHTQLDLARKLNYSDKSVSKWERGEGLPDVYILAQIAQLYGVTVSNLIGEEEPPKKANPHFHIYVLLLSVALVFVIAAILFTAFTIAAVPFPSWLFFLYAVPVSSIVCIVFTSLWWGILMQTLSITALIWSAGACIYLSIPIPIPNLSLIFVVCAAVQVLITLWELFRFSRTRTWF